LDGLWQMVEKYKVEERNKVCDTIGKNWITQFLNRHLVLASKFAQRMDRQRVFANNLTLTADHFKRLGKILRQENFKPYAIANVDEKGIILGYSSKSKVITRCSKKTPYIVTFISRVMVCGHESRNGPRL
jgi:hypothetical protein